MRNWYKIYQMHCSSPSTTAQPSEEPQPKKNYVLTPSTTVVGITKGIQMTVPEQLGEDRMDTSNEADVQV